MPTPKTKDIQLMRLTGLRLLKDWSKAELGRRAMINPATVGLIENQRFVPYPSQLAKLAKALGVPKGDAGTLTDIISTLPGETIQ